MRLLIFISVLFLFSFEALAKNCKKGIPCGNSCISASKTCHIGSSSITYSTNSVSTNTSTIKSITKSSSVALLYYSVNLNDIPGYADKSIQSEILFRLNKNDKVQVLSTYDDWYKISFNERIGFIKKSYGKGNHVINK